MGFEENFDREWVLSNNFLFQLHLKYFATHSFFVLHHFLVWNILSQIFRLNDPLSVIIQVNTSDFYSMWNSLQIEKNHKHILRKGLCRKEKKEERMYAVLKSNSFRLPHEDPLSAICSVGRMSYEAHSCWVLYFVFLAMCMSQQVAIHTHSAMQWGGKGHGRKNSNRFIKIMFILI